MLALPITPIAHARKEDKMNNNIDKEILEEFREQKAWWEQHLNKLKMDTEEAIAELAKVNRLIEVFKEKIQQ